jgi:hypothetical protein
MQRRAHFLAEVGENIRLDAFRRLGATSFGREPFLDVARVIDERRRGDDRRIDRTRLPIMSGRSGLTTGKNAPSTTIRQATPLMIHRPARLLCNTAVAINGV